MLDLDSTLAFATDLAREAGAHLCTSFEKMRREGIAGLNVRTKSSARDFVTDVDVATQRFLIGRIQTRFPSHRFIAEEEGADTLGDPASPFTWVIDPLDGTMNFVHASPVFGTMIALLEHGKPVVGVILLPMSGTLFTARKGAGATCNGTPVRLRPTQDMNDAILSTNLSSRARPCAENVLHVPVLPCASLHNYGCAASEIGAILEGRNDGIFYEGVGLWDIAPGCLMIQESGGKARWEFVDPGLPRNGVNCVASTATVFAELERFIFP